VLNCSYGTESSYGIELQYCSPASNSAIEL
jgi:hypothetical protein